MTLEGGHDQGKQMSLMLTEPLSVPLNNRSITLENAGPSRIERKQILLAKIGTLLVKGKQAVEGLINDDVERGTSLNTATLSWTLEVIPSPFLVLLQLDRRDLVRPKRHVLPSRPHCASDQVSHFLAEGF